MVAAVASTGTADLAGVRSAYFLICARLISLFNPSNKLGSPGRERAAPAARDATAASMSKRGGENRQLRYAPPAATLLPLATSNPGACLQTATVSSTPSFVRSSHTHHHHAGAHPTAIHRPEEVEALEGKEAQQAGTWQKASADVLKRRRIVKASSRGPRPGMRPPSPRRLPTGEVSESVSASYPGPDLGGGGGGSSGLGAAEEPANPAAAAPAAAAPAAAAAAAANPFAGFSGLTSSSPTKAPAASNPFAGFSGLTAAAPKPLAASVAAAPSNPFAGFSGLTGGGSAAASKPEAPFSPPAVLPPAMAKPSLGRQLTSPNDGAHDAAAAAAEPKIPSQAELLPHWEQHIKNQGTVYRKAALVFAKVCDAAGTLDTVLGGKNETTNTYKPGDLIVHNPGGER